MKKYITLFAVGLALCGCQVSEQPDGDKTVGVNPDVAEGAKKAADTTVDVAGQMAMTTKIEGALRSAESVKIEDLNVDTVDKTITLKGYVDTAEHKAKAEQITKDMAGPDYKVNNMLAVKSEVSK